MDIGSYFDTGSYLCRILLSCLSGDKLLAITDIHLTSLHLLNLLTQHVVNLAILHHGCVNHPDSVGYLLVGKGYSGKYLLILTLGCVILVDGETGLMHDYKKISDVIKTGKNAHFLVDATQAIGKFKLDFSYLELVSFAPHKFGGIIGSGCLIKRKNTILTPLFHGGESDSIYRSGSVPLGIIASIEKALELAYSSLDENYIKVNNINKYILNELNKINKIKINSFTNPYIINISIDGFLSRQSVDFLNNHDICVSQKSACSIKNTPSKIIMAIYKDKKRASSSLRISLSELVTIEEAEQLIKVIKELIK